MCGVAGAIGYTDSRITESIKRATATMHHRGPDAEGFWTGGLSAGGKIVLGHRRLSILDLSDRGRQPMTDEITGCVISYNGEVYNFLELRAELRARGYVFFSNTDTEVVLRAYAEWGERCVEKFVGMFAFALWDPRSESLILVRDRMGIKPLYFAQLPLADGKGAVVFASELRALIATDLFERRLDPAALETYLWNGFVVGPNTIIKGIRLLEAGTIMRVSSDGIVWPPARYWDSPIRRDKIDEKLAMRTLSERLQTSVQRRLVSDVPLGVFLSGGIDSSAVAALASEVSSQPLNTFNIAYDEKQYDESSYALAVSRALGTEHHEVPLTSGDFHAHLTEALYSLDQPSFDGINTFFVSRAVREAGVTVALTGTGGDELFGGYDSFRDIPRARHAARCMAFLPPAMIRPGAELVTALKAGRSGTLLPQIRWGKLADALLTRGDPAALYQVSAALFTRRFTNELLADPGGNTTWCGLPGRIADRLRSRGGGHLLEQISIFEQELFLSERLLRDTDTTSMAVSLEVRLPLIDHTVVEALSMIAPERRFLPVCRKLLLRETALRSLNPRLFERKKCGFELPMDIWCRGQLANELSSMFSDTDLCESLGLRNEAVLALWEAFEARAPAINWYRIWAIYVILWWCKRYGVSR